MLSEYSYLTLYTLDTTQMTSVPTNSFEEKYSSQVHLIYKYWNVYSALIDVEQLIKKHPNYDPTGSGTSEVIFTEKLQPNTVEVFSSVAENVLYRYVYNKVALYYFKKVNTKNNYNSIINEDIVQNITILKSENNDLLNNLKDYNPFVQTDAEPYQKLYIMNEDEKNFVILIVRYFDYFSSLVKLPIDDIRNIMITSVSENQMKEIFKKIYKHNPDIGFNQQMLKLGQEVISYVFLLKSIMEKLNVNLDFLGLTLFFFIKENFNDALLQIANYCNFYDKILLLNT